jgi:hypothetical protein
MGYLVRLALVWVALTSIASAATTSQAACSQFNAELGDAIVLPTETNYDALSEENWYA